jgi:hypothetical protein
MDYRDSIDGKSHLFLPIETKKQLYKDDELLKEYKYKELFQITIFCDTKNLPSAFEELDKFFKDRYGDVNPSEGGDTFPAARESLIFQMIFWTAGLLVVCAIFLLINKKCLSTFLFLTYSSKDKILVKTCLLTGMGGLLGVVFGGIISRYLMTEPKISILSIFVSLSICIIYGLLVAIRTNKKLRIEVEK